jgi:FtsH-binding integral membrane protein
MYISNFFDASSTSQYWSTFFRNLSTSLAPWSRAILATSTTALVGLGTYRWSQTNASTQTTQDELFNQMKDRVKHTYAYVFGGFALTAAAAIVSHISGLSLKILNNNSYILPIGLTVTTFGSLIATLSISKEDQKAKHVAWVIFNSSMGILFSPLGFLNQAIVAQAAAISLGVGGLLTLAAYLAPDKRFLEWEGPLMAALTSLSIATTVAIFFPQTAFAYGVDRASLYGGLLIFTGLFMSSTHRLTQEAETQPRDKFDPINSSMNIYLDGLNIFIRVLRILVENKEKEQN